jgi:pimeloyl-ACP methyl ester carboxylesterase
LAKTIFLPGAGGQRSFWQPVCNFLGLGSDEVRMGWPGFGDEPVDPGIHGLSDLVGYVLQRVPGDINLVAQSMGGVVALQIALQQPERIRRLVLCGTSGGVDFKLIDRQDWRPAYLAEMPETSPRWFIDDRTDITDRLSEITMPARLIWGGEDRIVPPAAGRLLADLLPYARIVVVAGAGHDVAVTKPNEVAGHIATFLSEDPITRTLSLEGEEANPRSA